MYEQQLDEKTRRLYYRIAIASFVIGGCLIGVAWYDPNLDLMAVIGMGIIFVGVAFRIADRGNVRIWK